MHGDPDIPLADKVEFLSRGAAYGGSVEAVEVIQTHMSWLFLTADDAYKLKKPIRLSFLDFRTVASRQRNCLQEIRLNRRLAPEVYLGARPLTVEEDGGLALDGRGTVVDWLVHMRRLPADRMLDHMMAGGRVERHEIEAIAGKLARFYRRASPVDLSAPDYRQRFRRDVEANHAELVRPEFRLSPAQVARVSVGLLAMLAAHPDLFDARVQQKRIIEAHGDLRPEHICLLEEPVFIDRLEFNREFRLLDPGDEISFLAIECEHAGDRRIGEIVLEKYRAITGDRPPPALLDFYRCYRAGLRAKLCAWHVRDHPENTHEHWLSRARGYLEMAHAYATRLPVVACA